MIELYNDFILKLKKLFGKFDESNHRFEKASNSEIARELGYSDAQFSRLINESATEGEYQRAIQNLDRILRVEQLERELGKEGKPKTNWKHHPVWFFGSVILLIMLGFTFYLGSLQASEDPYDDDSNRYEMLKWTFETQFINPYVKLAELPEDCDYPCYKYQGKWELKDSYKIPFFRERNGFHYLATEVSMYGRCMSEKSNMGDIVEGFEYQKHEIWYDKRELPLDSFTADNNRLKQFYQELDFTKDENFIKVATVHTFFRNELLLEDSLIHRTGKVIGRDLEFVSPEELEDIFTDRRIIQDIQNELNRIASNRLEDFSRPISCNSAIVPKRDFHQVKDGDEISFDCMLTTNRVSFNYNKTYTLVDQFIENSCRSSE